MRRHQIQLRFCRGESQNARATVIDRGFIVMLTLHHSQTRHSNLVDNIKHQVVQWFYIMLTCSEERRTSRRRRQSSKSCCCDTAAATHEQVFVGHFPTSSSFPANLVSSKLLNAALNVSFPFPEQSTEDQFKWYFYGKLWELWSPLLLPLKSVWLLIDGIIFPAMSRAAGNQGRPLMWWINRRQFHAPRHQPHFFRSFISSLCTYSNHRPWLNVYAHMHQTATHKERYNSEEQSSHSLQKGQKSFQPSGKNGHWRRS